MYSKEIRLVLIENILERTMSGEDQILPGLEDLQRSIREFADNYVDANDPKEMHMFLLAILSMINITAEGCQKLFDRIVMLEQEKKEEILEGQNSSKISDLIDELGKIELEKALDENNHKEMQI